MKFEYEDCSVLPGGSSLFFLVRFGLGGVSRDC